MNGGSQYSEGQTAINPATGQRAVFRGGGWHPFDSGSSGPPGLGEVYREKVAQPLTNAVAQGIVDPRLANPAQYMEGGPESFTPHHQLAPWAKQIAEYIVPQTATQAATTVGALAMPEVGLTEKLGTQALGPMERLLSSRLMRTAAGTGLGAAAGQVSGEGAGQGALQGAETFVPGELIGAGMGRVGRKLGEPSLVASTTKDFGQAISKLLPWAGKIEKGSDFADAFMGGDQSRAILSTGQMLRDTKQSIAQGMKGHIFNLPNYEPVPPGAVRGIGRAGQFGRKPMGFQEADQLISDLQKGFGFTQAGDPRTGASPREMSALAYRIRDELAAGLNKVKAGAGDQYLAARKKFDAAKTLTDMFDARGLFDARGMNQAKLAERVRQHSEGLERSLGPGTTKSLLDTLRRGFLGEGEDVAGKAGHGNWYFHGGFLPTYHRSGGHGFKPIGEVPRFSFMRPQMKEIEAGISNALPQQQPPQSGPGTDALDQSRAEAVAPTPSASTRALKVGKDLAKGKQPDVHRDLARGRLSEPEVEKLLQYANSSDPNSIVQGMPIEEVLNAAEVAGPDERKMLIPMILQRLKAELPKMQNKTQQANLAQRFQRLQVMPAQAEA